jgi:hypothetical protein
MEAVMVEVTQGESAQRLRDAAMSIVDLSQWVPGIVFDLKHELFMKDSEAIHPRLSDKYEVGNLPAGKYYNSIKKALGVDDSTMMAIQDAVMVGRSVYGKIVRARLDEEITAQKKAEEEYQKGVANGTIVPDEDVMYDAPVSDQIERVRWAFQAVGLLKNAKNEICRIRGKNLETLDSSELLELVSSRVNFVASVDKKTGEPSYAIPNEKIVKAGLRAAARMVLSVSDIPTFDANWQIQFAPGLQKDGTYLLENTIKPDMEFGSVANAVQYLENELLCDMLFKAPKDRLNYWALLFTPIVQRLIDYHRAPFFLVHKPKRGIGATAMVDVVYLINYGDWSMPQMALTSKRDEYQVSNELLGHLERRDADD